MTAQRMFLLELGQERVPKSLSVLGAGDHPITTPVYGVLVETSDGLVLLDTGLGGTALADTPAMEALYGGPDMLPSGPDGEPLEVALAELGFTVDDISLAAVSHLHLDHTGGVPMLTAAAVPVVIHEDEIAYGRDRAAQGTEREVAFWKSDYTLPATQWRTVAGDEQIAPGVHVLRTPGHTPGHLSYRVDLSDTGTWLFAADAADLGENLLERVPCGSTAEADDVPRALASVNRLMDEGDRLDARVVPGHDAVFWKAVWHPRDGHR
jgi:N-acyl homoserine lactone hydrolase